MGEAFGIKRPAKKVIIVRAMGYCSYLWNMILLIKSLGFRFPAIQQKLTKMWQCVFMTSFISDTFYHIHLV